MKAALLLLALRALPVPTEEEARVILESSVPAPVAPATALSIWRYDGTETRGIWLPDAQAERVAAELKVCRTEALDLQRSVVPWWWWTLAGAVVGGGAVWLIR